MRQTINLSYDHIHANTVLLCQRINKVYAPTLIVTLGLGGLVPATIAGKYFDIKVLNYGVTSYLKGEHSRTDFKLYQNIEFDKITDEKVLIIDDIIDSGETMKHITELCDSNNIFYKTASLFFHKSACFRPDFHEGEVADDAWIIFPWERN